MPHIFPKRLLRNKDILDPEDLNEDFSPAQELIYGNLDAKNFKAARMKSKVQVVQGAYFTPTYQSVECDVSFGSGGAPRSVKSPNFVQEDGETFREHYPTDDGSTTPFVVPNNGSWAPIDGSTQGTAMTVDLDTGSSVLWLTGYVQYVWQGFYEPKSEDSEANDTDPDKFVPKSWPTDDYPYAYPPFEGDAAMERDYPGLGGWHHRSRGGRGSKVQFAFRVDGRIITASITGKEDFTEGTATGLKAGVNKAKTDGQKNLQKKASWDPTDAMMGQKLPKPIADAPGPEVMPVRFGAAVPVAPGSHTIEIVARRRPRHTPKQYERGDYVGVFTRRVLCLELPNQPPVNDERTHAEPIPDYDTEQVLSETVLHTQSAERLRERLNNVRNTDVLRHSLPNTHLPSKVAYANRVTITPTTEKVGNKFRSTAWSRARWPGWRGGTTSSATPAGRNPPDHVVTQRTDGWRRSFRDDDHGAGWFMLDSGGGSPSSSTKLQIDESSTGKLNVSTSETLIIQADVFLRSMVPGRSDFINELDTDTAEAWEDYKNYDMPHKYLDLFGAFSLGYYDSDQGKWIIASKFRPAWVNHFNWHGRRAYYAAYDLVDVNILRNIGGGWYDELEDDLRDERYVDTSSWSEDFRDWVSVRPTDTPVDLRAGETDHLWQFCNIPLFAVIDSEVNIDKLAVFCCSTAPGFHTYTDGDFEHAPRDAIGSVKLHWGRSSLMALKLTK